VRQIQIDRWRAITNLEIDEIEATAENPTKGDFSCVLWETFQWHFVLEQRIVRDHDLTELGTFEPRWERLVAEHDMSFALHDARHLSEGLPWLAEVVEPAEMKDGVERAIGKRQEASGGYEVLDSRRVCVPAIPLQALSRLEHHSFRQVLDEEFALLSNLMRKEARQVLQQLNNEGYIDKIESENGVLWKRKEPISRTA